MTFIGRETWERLVEGMRVLIEELVMTAETTSPPETTGEQKFRNVSDVMEAVIMNWASGLLPDSLPAFIRPMIVSALRTLLPVMIEAAVTRLGFRRNEAAAVTKDAVRIGADVALARAREV